jgi:uncharacterized membrane protein YsdA (DUF1294 family)
MRPAILYSLMGAALVLTFFLPLRAGLELPLYASWLGAAGLATFALYGLDKRLARTGRRPRVPERVFNFLSLIGGFIGAWLGRTAFHHKTDTHGHADMYLILVASTVAHCLLICLVLAARS